MFYIFRKEKLKGKNEKKMKQKRKIEKIEKRKSYKKHLDS